LKKLVENFPIFWEHDNIFFSAKLLNQRGKNLPKFTVNDEQIEKTSFCPEISKFGLKMSSIQVKITIFV